MLVGTWYSGRFKWSKQQEDGRLKSDKTAKGQQKTELEDEKEAEDEARPGRHQMNEPKKVDDVNNRVCNLGGSQRQDNDDDRETMERII